eukprot:CAMPEP_0174929686 /NCGR_PEP_ID=MMETSP1355-20121228/28297_1 /TAXON_ID=464990 /ORGANISM="Hemiselmis tepida, Strain CCMP443" /LENGTH=44 /DNA_ID= /DNA_START= /DNA_END= /DNA_ORIENTATION=
MPIEGDAEKASAEGSSAAIAAAAATTRSILWKPPLNVDSFRSAA